MAEPAAAARSRPARLAVLLAAALVLPVLTAGQPPDDEDAPRHGARPDAETDAGLEAESDAASRELGIELPAGPGRALVLSACMPCHNLAGIAAFKGYWNREQWAAMVATMIGHGAKLDAAETEVVVAYLTAHFGVTEQQRQRGMADESTDPAR